MGFVYIYGMQDIVDRKDFVTGEYKALIVEEEAIDWIKIHRAGVPGEEEPNILEIHFGGNQEINLHLDYDDIREMIDKLKTLL
jgi:hypothetical protein